MAFQVYICGIVVELHAMKDEFVGQIHRSYFKVIRENFSFFARIERAIGKTKYAPAPTGWPT